MSRRYLIAVAALALAGCVETAGDFSGGNRSGARAPAGVPVALVSLAGAPEAVITRVSSALSRQAAQRSLQIVGVDGQPRYQLRGYLAAQASADGRGEVAWAFDIYDSTRKRTRRLSGEEPVSASTDVWSALGEAEVERVAARALDQIVGFLSDSPEAIAGGAVRPAVVATSASSATGL
ncbi:MAG: hypothetical protein ACRC7G_08775 [Beijerinckiaceae bacterium]